MIMDRYTKLGMIFAGLGGIIAIVCMPFSYTNDLSTFVPLGACLLLAVMFFAMCGAFSKNGQWTPKALTFFAFITAGVIVGVTIPGYIDLYFGIIELVLAALVIIISYNPATQRFVSQAD